MALGGAALANGASSTTSTTPPAAQQGAPTQRPDPTTPGDHVGANGKTEAALPSAVAAKVKSAAEAKLPGATLERVETDVDYGSPYEARMRKADGTEVSVLVDASFNVTAVHVMQHP